MKAFLHGVFGASVTILFLVLAFLVTATMAGCQGWEPDFWCKNYTPEVGSTAAYITYGDAVDTQSEERLATVRLLNSNGRPVCSGVIVGPHSVLTAAHCSGLSAIDLEPGGQVWAATDKLVHPNYLDEGGFPGSEWDLAFLYFDEVLPEPYIGFIYDPAMGGYEPDVRYFCEGLLLHGWGRAENGYNGVTLFSAPWEIGRATGWHVIEGRGLDGQSACPGDSGGPLYAFISKDHPWFDEDTVALMAITSATSWYSAECDTNIDHVYLDTHGPWVRENIR